MKLIPVKYHKKNYPTSIQPQLIEVAGNMDSKQVSVYQPYSLHTEYSYAKRQFDSGLLDGLDELKNANHNGIPQLWKSKQWSEEFSTFIKRLVGTSTPPEVIEIHPPFLDYCADIATFWERYLVFYNAIKDAFPKAKVLIENRCGTTYSKSAFLLSTCNDVVDFCKFLSNGHTELGMIIDYPQLFSAEKIKMDNLKQDKILRFNKEIKDYAHIVDAIHLWGKQKKKAKNKDTYRWSPHSGDLNTFFSNDFEKKAKFLASLTETFDDQKERYFVPEVNTTEDDLQSIILDMVSAGITFVQAGWSNHLISIDWETGTPQFVMQSNDTHDIKRLDAIGRFLFSVGTERYCIGNRDMVDHRPFGCPSGKKVVGNSLKCISCEQDDILKYCARCTGRTCRVTNQVVLNRCAEEHFIYLAFFSPDAIKVGVAHNRRKYTRLYEQGALCALLAFSCSDGKTARVFENRIRTFGVKDRISSEHKLYNLECINSIYAQKVLMKIYHDILDFVARPDGISPIIPPEFVSQQDAIHELSKIPSGSQQLSLWGDTEPGRVDAEILQSIDGFQGEICTFVGSIAVIKSENRYFLFNFKNIIGREIEISPLSQQQVIPEIL